MVDNSNINIFFVSNLPFEVTKNELKEFFSPRELIYCKLKNTELGIKCSHGYLGFKNKKEDIISYVENNKFKNKKMEIELIEDGSDSEEESENERYNKEYHNEKHQSFHGYKNLYKNNGKEVYKEMYKYNNIKLNKHIEIINENGEITKHGFLILKNMNMYDIVLLIKKIQELVRLSPQTAIQLLHENKTIYYSLVHALFLLGILNIEINPLSNEEIEKSSFYKIKSRFQYLYMGKEEDQDEEKEYEKGRMEMEEEEEGIDMICSNDNKENEKKKKKRNYELSENSETDIYLNGKKRKMSDEQNESVDMNYNFASYKKNYDTCNNIINMKFNINENDEKSNNLMNNRNISRNNYPSKNSNYYTKNIFPFNNSNKNIKRDDYKQNHKMNENSINENNNEVSKKKNYINKSYHLNNNNSSNVQLIMDKKKGNSYNNKTNKNMNYKNMKNISFFNNKYNSKTNNNSFKNSIRTIDSTNEKNSKLLYSYKNKDFVQNKLKNKNSNYSNEENFINKNRMYMNNYKEDTGYEYNNNGNDNVNESLRNPDNVNVSKINESDKNNNYYNNFNNMDNENTPKVNEKDKNYKSENEKINKGFKKRKLHDAQNNYDNNSSNLSDCSSNNRNKKSYISSNRNINTKNYIHSLYKKEDPNKINNEINMDNANKISKEINMNNLNEIKHGNNKDYINGTMGENKAIKIPASPQNLCGTEKSSNNYDSTNLKNNNGNNTVDDYNNSNYNSDTNLNNSDGKNISNSGDKNLEYGKKLMQKIKTSNNQRRGIKLIDRKNNEEIKEEKIIKVKNININHEKKDYLNKKSKKENNINVHLKMLLNKLKINLSDIPNAEEDLLNEIINQKAILQNILVSKYTDMLNWPNEQILRVLSIRKSLKNKGYNINDII